MHALLIGIDRYTGAMAPLRGCVNDIDAMQRILIDRLGVAPDRIHRLASPHDEEVHEIDVPSRPATRDNILAALRALDDDRITHADRVFIYYSGHGTGLTVQSGGVKAAREALVAVDAVRDGRGFVSGLVLDVELNALLARIAGHTRQVTVILDCCHSAGATRAVLDPDEATRSVLFEAPIDATDLQLDAALAAAGERAGADGSIADCQIVAACLADEKAVERGDHQGKTHGLLTRHLLAALAAFGDGELPSLPWGRIWRRIVAEMGESRPQHPSLIGSYARPVFGGEPLTGDPGYGVKRRADRYLLDVGELVGVTSGAVIGVYGHRPARFEPLGSEADLQARVGTLKVDSARRSSSEAVAVGTPFDLPDGARGRLVEPGGPARMTVSLHPADEALAAGIRASKLLRFPEAGHRAAASLVRRTDMGWAVTDDVHGPGETEDEPALVVIPPDQLHCAVAVLEHYVRYSAPLRLSQLCTDLPGQLELEVLDLKGAELSTDERHVVVDGQLPAVPVRAVGPRGCIELDTDDRVAIRVTNSSKSRLKVFLFDCAPEGYAAKLGDEIVLPGRTHVFWHRSDQCRFFQFQPPAGKRIGLDRLVAIGTTAVENSLDHLHMDKKPDFESLLSRDKRGERGVRDDDDEDDYPPPEYWTAARVTLRVQQR